MIDPANLIVTLALNAVNKDMTDEQFRQLVLNSSKDVVAVQDWIQQNPGRAKPLVESFKGR